MKDRSLAFVLRSFACALCCIGMADAAVAEEKPLWEAGAGVMDMVYPAYRGSSDYRNFVFPVPYLVYRGDFLKADRNGVRGVFFGSDRIELNLSMAISPPVTSNRVSVRSGMPDLRPSIELGPSLDLRLWQSDDRDQKVRLFCRCAGLSRWKGIPDISAGSFTPRLNLDIDNPKGLPGWTLGFIGGPVYGSARQHDYFYGVAPQYATATRSAYEAKTGYAGMQFLAALWKRYPSFWVGGFVRYDNLHGAVIESSPLVTQKSGFAGGIAISWILGESRERVSVD